MTPPPTPEPWGDDRLGAAFATRAGRARMPVHLESATRASLRGEQTSAPTLRWRRLLAPATVLVLAIATVAGGAMLIRGSLGSAGFVQFRDGPTPDLRTLDAGTFVFDFPADWLAYDASAAFSGGSSTAVIGTQPVEARCGDVRHVDINCVYEQPLEPGDVRVFVGSGGYRGGTVLDRADIENGTSARLAVGGMPAIRNDYDVQPDTYYREDVSMAWEIALPTSLSNVIRIEVRAREWPFRGRVNTAAEVRAAVQTMVDSFRFTPPPVPLPADPSAAVAAARAAIETKADGFRRGYVDLDSSALTYLDCPGDEPAAAARASVRYGPGGDLGRPVDLVCSWTVTPEAPSIWRLDLTYEWSADGRSGRYVETLWLDATATAVASTFAGDPPPVAASELSGPTEVAGLKVIPVVDAIEIRDAGVDDRELAVRGWFSANALIGCPAPAEWPTSPVQPVCPDQWTVLMQDPEVLFTVERNGATGRGPGGPSIQVDLDDIDRTWEPSLPDLGPASPVQIVVIGHFDDRRSRLCPQELEQACRDRFVVDRVDWVDGGTLPLSELDLSDGDETSRVGDVLKHLDAETPGSPILSIAVVDGPTGIGRIEPSLGTGRGGFIDQRAIWVIRVLEGDRAVTYLVIDGTDAVFEMAADGEPVAMPAAPAPVETPSQGHAIILTVPASPGPSLTIGVEDQDSLIREARLAIEDEMRRFGGGTSLEGVRLVKIAGDDTFYVSWVGYLCDPSYRLVVDGTDNVITSMDVYGQRERCAGPTVERAVILRAKRPTDSTGIVATDHLLTHDFPGSTFGLPVVDVERAQDVQHVAGDAHEIAVSGWLSIGPPMSCAAPLVEPASRLQRGCGDDLTWLLGRPEILTFRDGPTVALREPTGPGIHVRFETGPVDWPPVDDPETFFPVPIVALGHFDDPAAASCPTADEAWCQDLFIIDGLAWAYGHELSFAGQINDPKVTSSPNEIVQAIADIDPAARIVAAWPAPGRGLHASELGLTDLPKAIRTAARVWIVKVIGASRTQSYLVLDDTHVVYRVLDDGTVERMPAVVF